MQKGLTVPYERHKSAYLGCCSKDRALRTIEASLRSQLVNVRQAGEMTLV